MNTLENKGLITIEGMKFHNIEGFFGAGKKAILAKEIADVHNKETKYINKLINNNRIKFKDNIDIIDLKAITKMRKSFFTQIGFTNAQFGNAKSIYILSNTGYCKLLTMFDDKRIGEIILEKYFNTVNNVMVLTNRKEIDFLNELEEVLKAFNYKHIRQYSVLGKYRIDMYIKDLNIAIEYDENNHEHYSYEKHKGRQIEIEKELGCKFIRVSDRKSNAYNIGLIMKEVFNYLHNNKIIA